MTLEEAIKHAEEVAEENQRVVDTGIVYDDVTIDMLYCDDTEVIEEHLANYQMCADEHRQLAEWLKDYKQLLDQKPCEEAISRRAVIDGINEYFHDEYYQRTSIQDCRDCLIEDVIKDMPTVTPQQKTGHWRPIYQGDEIIGYRCSECEFGRTGSIYRANYCHNCGADMREGE